jgi:diguanylate cyclase (GGDEF)-like protein
MKRLVIALVIAFGCARACVASEPVKLTSLQQIHALSNEQAAQHIPVEFVATVLYFRGYERTLFVQDGDTAIYVSLVSNLNLEPGDRIRIKGTTGPSFRPYIAAESVAVVGKAPLPTPVPATFDELIRARYDCRWVTVRGRVRSANVLNAPEKNAALQILTEGGNVGVALDTDRVQDLKALIDAEVEVTGAASGVFDGKMQQTGVLLHAPRLADIKVLKGAAQDPWSIPLTPMGEILTAYHVTNQTARVRVRGTITYYQPGSALVLQDGPRSLWITTETRSDMRVGDIADATGLPDVYDGFLTLTQGEVQDTGVRSVVAPQYTTGSELSQSKRIFDLVTTEGELVMQVRAETQDEYVLLSDGHLFSAIYRHPAGTLAATGPLALPAMKVLPLRSKIRVTGVCVLEDANPFNAQVPFDILLRSPDDILVVASSPWLNVRNLVIVVCVLLVALLLAAGKGWSVDRRARRQTAELAYIERRRSRILEDISGSRPVTEIIEQITELVSFSLRGAPCWCQVADGPQLGNRPPRLEGLRVEEHEISAHPGSAHPGPPLGTISAAFDPHAKPLPRQAEALTMAGSLTALAIETRRLYSDLLKRSEYDLLTDVHNRFSLDKNLDAQIERSRADASVFGLIYIDLDRFKLINDLYGHRIGDLYLQQASVRMKGQLRSMDTLGRIGGDEFAAVVPAAHGRVELAEIAQRLERAFDQPFEIEGLILHETASVGCALYPEDGDTRDRLLVAADAAMYEVKNRRRQADRLLHEQPAPGIV